MRPAGAGGRRNTLGYRASHAAMVWRADRTVPRQVLRDAVFAHPTLAESLTNLFGALEG